MNHYYYFFVDAAADLKSLHSEISRFSRRFLLVDVVDFVALICARFVFWLDFALRLPS